MPNFFRNRVTEQDIREWMDQNGYQGSSAILDSVDLFALQRPGWKQLFRFQGKVRKRALDDDQPQDRRPFGESLWMMKEDQRTNGQR